MLPPKEMAYGIICICLGVNLMTQLDDDNSRVESLFELANNLAPIFGPLFQTS